ncbi:MAG: AAA family ATPase [bacterium]
MDATTLSPLKRISIKGYKSIRVLDLPLSSLNVLIGANGSGKSNFISAFKLLNQIASSRLHDYVATHGGADTMLHFGRKGSESMSIFIEIADVEYAIEFVPTITDGFIIHEDFRGEEDSIGETLRQWSVFHFNDTSDTAKVRGASNINDNDRLRPDGSNLAAILFLLQQKYATHYRNIVDVIQMVAPFFDTFLLKPDPLNEQVIRLAWRQRGSEQYFDANALSDGTLRFICLAILLMQPNQPPLILLDEPEMGLHPAAIAILAGMIRSVSKSTQIILSTQSSTLVNQFEPEDIIVADRKGSESVFRHITREELGTWLDDYSLAELWEKNVLGGRPR